MSNEESEILVKWGDDLTSTNYVKCENGQEETRNNNKPIKIRVSGEIEIENMGLLEFNKISNSVKVNRNTTDDDLKDIFKG